MPQLAECQKVSDLRTQVPILNIIKNFLNKLSEELGVSAQIIEAYSQQEMRSTQF